MVLLALGFLVLLFWGVCNFCLPGWLLIFVLFGCLGCLICVGFEFVQISGYVGYRNGFWVTRLWVSGYGCFIGLSVLLLWVCFLGVLPCLVIMYYGVWGWNLPLNLDVVLFGSVGFVFCSFEVFVMPLV